MVSLDLKFVRQHFPAFNGSSRIPGHFFDSAAGSFPCEETVSALNDFYLNYKVQPGNPFPASEEGMARMLASKSRWAEALGVADFELGFGPSTSQNTYVLAQAFSGLLGAGDEVIVTNQDHESNTGAIRRAVTSCGATLREWQVDPEQGLLDLSALSDLLNARTALVCFPHASNITGQKNDASKIVKMAKEVGARTLVDGVSYVPHDLPDVGKLDADIYLFSLYKVYSVHLGVMVVRQSLLDELPAQGHYFKSALDVNEKLVPAGPDHAQIAAAGAVLDYVETLATHHGGSALNLADSCRLVGSLWREHEQKLVAPLIDCLQESQNARLLGSTTVDEFRCPLVSFAPTSDTPGDLSFILNDQKMLLSSGHYYAPRLLEAVGIDPASGVIRISMAHYNTEEDVLALVGKLRSLL